MFQRRTSPVGVGLILAFTTLLLFLRSHPWQQQTPQKYPGPSRFLSLSSFTRPAINKNEIEKVDNHTLGFERIFAVGLPERSDKRDALTLTSSLTGFHVDWVDGIRGESVVNKAVPFGIDRAQLWENNLGSWRGHMNAIRTIVEERITTALIMEDDMDWDIRLKSQLKLIAHGSQILQSLTAQPVSSSSSSPSTSPYGSDWDLLWLGHCGEVFPENLEENGNLDINSPEFVRLSRKFTIHPDATVPPPAHARGFQNFSENPYTRWVHVTGGPICTFAYALSLHGARKVLYDLSVDHLAGPFDNALMGLCRWGSPASRLGMKCYSVTPPVFMHHKAKGSISGDSDIQSYGKDGAARDVGSTENIVWSARLNVREILMGEEPKSQFET